MIDAYLLVNTYLILLLWKMHAALWLCNVYYIIVTSIVNFPLLQPPIGEKRVEELGKWVRREFEAVLGVWTYEGVDVVLRNSLIPYRSHTFDVAGFTVSKIVSKADQALNKWHQNEKKRKQSDPKVSVPAESPILTVGADSNSC